MPPGAPPLYLVGFMGSGKSVVGRRLAKDLNWRFVDTDQRVEEAEGLSVEEIFRRRGEDRFREAERRVLRAISSVPEQVVATGGGMFVGFDQRALMKRTGTTLWLDAPIEEIRRRLGTGGGRPMWTPGEPRLMRALFEKRRAVYALAEIRIRTSGRTPAVISKEILERIGRLPDPTR